MSIQTTDIDVARDAAKILGTKVYGPYYRKDKFHKAVFHVEVSGKKAVSWMLTLYNFMSVRRRAQIARALAQWQERRKEKHG